VDQKRKDVATTSGPFTKKFVSVKKKEVKENNQSENLSSGGSNHLNTNSTVGNIIAETIPSPDSVTGNIDIEKKETSIDTTNEIIPEIKTTGKDSLSLKKIADKNDKSSKWKLAVTAGIGRSRVSNGVGLFGSTGGAKSLETNAFVADQNYSTGQLSSAPNNGYRPPSEQKRSSSFSLGLLVKKKVGKRSVFTTGLQYNFYSTEMLVGQNMLRDTAAAPTLRVQQFYANSGASFSEYNNEFHFISLPLAFDFQIIKKFPLDFHIGLSVQQLLKTNALLYSASSQIYYNDNSAFNKTHIFSEVGFMYSLPLKKKGVFQIGPELNYDHSKMGKENFKQHLFSYGLTTQFVFGSK
jgi:hypothetical protein